MMKFHIASKEEALKGNHKETKQLFSTTTILIILKLNLQKRIRVTKKYWYYLLSIIIFEKYQGLISH